MKTFSLLLAIDASVGQVIQSTDVFFVISVSKLLNKLSSYVHVKSL